MRILVLHNHYTHKRVGICVYGRSAIRNITIPHGSTHWVARRYVPGDTYLSPRFESSWPLSLRSVLENCAVASSFGLCFVHFSTLYMTLESPGFCTLEVVGPVLALWAGILTTRFEYPQPGIFICPSRGVQYIESRLLPVSGVALC